MNEQPTEYTRLVELLLTIPLELRAAHLQDAARFEPAADMEVDDRIGPLRAALADRWELQEAVPVPICQLRTCLTPPVAISVVLDFIEVGYAKSREEIDEALLALFRTLNREVQKLDRPRQLFLMKDDQLDNRASGDPSDSAQSPGRIVSDLATLVDSNARFRTIYADPPWQYTNRASRGAAENHYPTLNLDTICDEPVRQLAEENAHLHLWTTNAFLREAFDVMEAWGFEFKSSLIWVKPELGMGNYWRVSHEYLLLGVRGHLTFRECSHPSWLLASRSAHSRKPGAVRTLIERVSPGPYLELYGRNELRDSGWTVYGNQIERSLF